MSMEATLTTPDWITTPTHLPDDLRGFRIHMVGIGGSGMSGLAALLLRRGACVTGTAPTPSRIVAELMKRGARIGTEQCPDAVPPDAQLVVASAAISPMHPELTTAAALGVPTLKYAQLLGELMSYYDGIAVSGTHGKSTTTAWVAYILHRAGLAPNFVVGAVSPQLGGGSGAGGGRHFVAEACEYDRSFLNLRPQCAAILNVDEDHLDCYANLDAIKQAFAAFVSQIRPDGLLIYSGDDAATCEVAATALVPTESYGLGPDAFWRATDVRIRDGCYTFTAQRGDATLGACTLGIPGRHNVYNALATLALAAHAGVPWPTIADGLQSYQGVGRRLELRAEAGGVRVVDDYAHHPAEIRATLAAARERYQPQRLWCVFQPHQHSRTRFLLQDFAASFAAADRIIVPDIFFVRDSAREREAVRSEELVALIVARGGQAVYLPDFDEIVAHLARAVTPGDLVLTMGAGSIWKVADDLVRRLGGHLPA